MTLILDRSVTVMGPSAKKRLSVERRLIIVANRHPVTIRKDQNGEYEYKLSSGGLVTGLNGLPKSLKENSVYYGWPGLDVSTEEIEEVENGIGKEGGIPVWIDGKLMDLHYNGYCS